ncbi:MAG: 2-oxoacid:acceptor oxidoreductase subunit alpha [Thermaerobacter sp.]|nr:2-oxoacid:acceptor oxidoreductase subunit alpha [Thermaerobacter sp.]
MAAELISGNEACARGAIAAGLTFFAGYPISPSSEIAEALARLLPANQGVFIQMEDEMSSLGAVLGASLGGAKAMTATSGPGFTLMQEHLGYAGLAEIPCVVVDVMRVGPSTGVPTAPSQGDVMQARWGSHGDRATVALVPASVPEIYQMTITAFNIAERLRTPVVLLYDEVLAHMRERVELQPPAESALWERPRASAEPGPRFQPYAANRELTAQLPNFGEGYHFHVTGLMHDERGYPTTDPETVRRLMARLDGKVEPVPGWVPPERYRLDDADWVFVAYGITARVAREAVDRLRESGVAAGLYRPRVLWPVAPGQLSEQLGRARTVVVAEMNQGQWADVVARYRPATVRVLSQGKLGGEPFTTEELLGLAQELTAKGATVL